MHVSVGDFKTQLKSNQFKGFRQGRPKLKAGWFFIGLIIAGTITALLPDDLFGRYLGQGLPAMLIMLAIGIPLYICATASTPIAAALILKGVSPGTALVFLLAGPATNIASITALSKTMGVKSTVRYLLSIAIGSLGMGLLLDFFLVSFGINPQAMLSQVHEVMPKSVGVISALLLISSESAY